jgi:hypothetical protein
VKFLQLKNREGQTVKRYPYTAIEEARQIRALQIVPEPNQAWAMRFLDDGSQTFPSRISTIRTVRRHEFQARFHGHVEDQSRRHVYLKPQTPQWNRKVERSHPRDQTEFYQRLTYTDDVDPDAKLQTWENTL